MHAVLVLCKAPHNNAIKTAVKCLPEFDSQREQGQEFSINELRHLLSKFVTLKLIVFSFVWKLAQDIFDRMLYANPNWVRIS